MKFTFLPLFAVALVAVANAFTFPEPVPASFSSRDQRIKHFRLDKNRVAIDGYDPVSYFKSSGPLQGKASLAYDFDGVIYWFSSADNLAVFKTNPAKFEPAWGGWCGHAMAVRGEKVEINPVCYKIINGRNVLFFKTFYANALSNWEKEIKKTPENTLMGQGDDFWGKTILK